ncbi:hypothetical protein Tco_0441040 [Tanacetum coccineum]
MTYTGNFMPPTLDLSFTGLDEFVNKPVVENRKSDEEVSKVVRKSDVSHPAKAEARGVTSWISLQHNGVYYRDTKKKRN